MITYFKDKNHRSKKKYYFNKTITLILESLDTVVIIGAATTSVTLSVSGVALIVVPICVRFACPLSLGKKI